MARSAVSHRVQPLAGHPGGVGTNTTATPLLAHALTSAGSNTPGSDSFASVRNESSEALRDFGLGAQVLADLGLKKIRLMIHSDRKIAAIEGFGIEVVERLPLPTGRGAARRRATPLGQ